MEVEASQVALVVKNPPANAGNTRDSDSVPGSGRFPGRGNSNPVHGESHGQRSLVGYDPQCPKELDLTEMTWHACMCWRFTPISLRKEN